MEYVSKLVRSTWSQTWARFIELIQEPNKCEIMLYGGFYNPPNDVY